MKKLFTVMIFGLILSACDSSSHKKTTYQITDWLVAGITNPQSGEGAFGWAKMVIYKDSSGWKLNSNGDTIRVPLPMDTFYLVQTADYSCPVKDSAGKQVNNPQNHQPVYYLTWRTASPPIHKNRFKPEMPYPEDIMRQMIASQAVPDTAYKAPNMHVIVKDTARHQR